MGNQWSNRGAKRAREAREDLGLGPQAPVADLLALVEGQGAHVLVLDLPDDVAGAYLRRPGLDLLVVCGTDFPGRQRFTLAHELGHLRMGHGGAVDLTVQIAGHDHSPRELEANAFAAELLVPARAVAGWAARLRRRALGLGDVLELACRHGVSAIAALYRLRTCGAIAEERFARLRGEIEDGLHLELGERLGLAGPHDSLAAIGGRLPRIPAPVRDSLLGDVLAGEEDVEGAAARLGREPEEVRAALAGLGVDQLVPAAFGAA